MAQILVVALRAENSAALTIASAGHDVVFAAGFEAAVRKLERFAPDLLVSELRLGGFNGLHLVIRSQSTHPNMRAILLDVMRDPVVAREAERHGAVYLSEPVMKSDLLGHVSRLLTENNPQRRWPRKQPITGLFAHVARREARVVDLSYGGVRLELPPSNSIPARFHMVIPGFEVVVRARPVWTRFTPVGSISCGAEVAEANPQILARWRALVDSIPAA